MIPSISSLKYPKQLDNSTADYMIFTHSEYRTNRAIRGRQGGLANRGTTGQFGAAGPPPATGSAAIILYMPTSSPPTNQSADWGTQNFEGPLGALYSDAANFMANTVDIKKEDVASLQGAQAKGKSIGNEFLNQFKDNFAGRAGGAAKQAGLKWLAGKQGMSASQLMAMNKGEIYNPNVEMLYKGPSVRGFSFNFQFAPKSAQEAQTVNSIIMEFKKWSLPEATEGGMYKVPHIWNIKYETAGAPNRNMNLFKPCACTAVNVTANNGLDMHMAFEDGMPIITTMALNFTEVDVITRGDQDEAPNNIGY